MTLATGFSVSWHGVDGWLYFLAAVSFLLAVLAAFGTGLTRLRGFAIALIALGLLFWVLTFIFTSS